MIPPSNGHMIATGRDGGKPVSKKVIGREFCPGMENGGHWPAVCFVRPAGRTCLEVKILDSPGKGKS